MNVSNEQQVAEQAVVRAVRATRAADAETGPARHSQQTDRCPHVGRFAAVMNAGGSWSAAEAEHVRACAFCQKVFGMFAATAGEAARDETVLGLTASQDTQFGLNLPKPSGDTTKPG